MRKLLGEDLRSAARLAAGIGIARVLLILAPNFKGDVAKVVAAVLSAILAALIVVVLENRLLKRPHFSVLWDRQGVPQPGPHLVLPAPQARASGAIRGVGVHLEAEGALGRHLILPKWRKGQLVIRLTVSPADAFLIVPERANPGTASSGSNEVLYRVDRTIQPGVAAAWSQLRATATPEWSTGARAAVSVRLEFEAGTPWAVRMLARTSCQAESLEVG